MAEKNPFLFDKDFAKKENLSKNQILYIKNNNIIIYTLLSNIFAKKGELSQAKAALPEHIMQALSGELRYTDSDTGYNTNDLGGKFKFLLLELDKNPKAREIFNNSYFTKSLKSLFIGNAWKGCKTSWANYKMKDHVKLPEYVAPSDSAIVGALNIYLYNGEEIGIDMSKVIDTIVGVDKDGKYCLNPVDDLETINYLSSAVTEQTRILKVSPIFNDLYKDTTKLEIETEVSETEAE